MKLGDKVKHVNVHISGEVVKVDGPTVHVECAGGTYYDAAENWELLEDEAVGEEVLQVDSVEEV